MSSQKKRPVTLTEADRAELVRVTRTGVHPASMIRRARVLLALDTSVGVVDAKEVIAARLEVSGETIRLVAKRFSETGGDVWATVGRKQRPLPPVPSLVTPPHWLTCHPRASPLTDVSRPAAQYKVKNNLRPTGQAVRLATVGEVPR